MYCLKMFAFSLLLTLLVELPVSALLGARGKRALLIVLLANVLTNPAAVLLNLLCLRFLPALTLLQRQLPIELLVIFAETFVYSCFSVKKGDVLQHPACLSIICNLCSYGIGLLITIFR